MKKRLYIVPSVDIQSAIPAVSLLSASNPDLLNQGNTGDLGGTIYGD